MPLALNLIAVNCPFCEVIEEFLIIVQCCLYYIIIIKLHKLKYLDLINNSIAIAS